MHTEWRASKRAVFASAWVLTCASIATLVAACAEETPLPPQLGSGVDAGHADGAVDGSFRDAHPDAPDDAPTADAHRDTGGADADAGPGACTVVGASSDAGDAGTCAPATVTCTHPIGTHPAMNSGRCSMAQINRYYEDCVLGTAAQCQAFTQDAANAECLGCLVTPESASVWGALIARPNGTYVANRAGCASLYDVGFQDQCVDANASLEKCLELACDDACPGNTSVAGWQTSYEVCRAAARVGTCAGEVALVDACRAVGALSCEPGVDFATDYYAVAEQLCLNIRTDCGPEQTLKTFVPKAPAPFHQNVCSSAQLDAWSRACDTDVGGTAAACAQFQSSNSGCFACLQTPRSASAWGAVVTDPINHRAMLNTFGCITNATNDTTLMGCEKYIAESLDCQFETCGFCTYGGTGYGAAGYGDECSIAARHSVCEQYLSLASTCVASMQQMGGVAAQCVGTSTTPFWDLARTLGGLFCGP